MVFGKNGLEQRIIAHRRKIHGFAEVGFEVENTIGYIEGELLRLGVVPQRLGRGGLVADIGEGEDITLLRADVDALNMSEKSGESFAAENGNMHACGHDMNSAMLLGATEMILQNRGKIRGRIRVAFQPAEETLEGCLDMIDSGLLDGGRIRRAFMLHTLVATDMPTGTIVFPGRGVSTAASDFFGVEIIGRGSHGADPSAGCDALYVGGKILDAIYGIVGRETSVTESVTLSVGRFFGGDAPNAIAERAELFGTLRTYESRVRERMLSRIEQIGNGIGEAYSASVSFKRTSGCPSFICDPELSDVTAEKLENVFGERVVRTPDGTLGGGSEDFAYVSQRVPSLMILISAGSRDEGYTYPLHNPACRLSESVLLKGAQIYAALCT